MIRSGILIAMVAFAAVNAFGLPVEPFALHVFGSACTNSTPTNLYSAEKGFGFEPGVELKLGSNYVTSDKPFSFSVKLPEGNYNVTVKLGDQAGESVTTVKAESRELMLENVKSAAGKSESRTFTVNIRTPKLPGGGQVSLNQRESDPPLKPHWDERLTLEFSGKRPGLDTLEISKAPEAITVFIAGDSTVTQQAAEPWAGWGQMLPRFFKPGVAIANHAESGLALYSFKGQKRLDKVSAMKPGDYFFIQFGHNDQKDKKPGSGPFTSYKENLKFFIGEGRKAGGNVVLVTPMERRRWGPDGKPQATLADYAEAVRQVGKEENVPVIDLNAMSLKFYEALGIEGSKKAFVYYPANTFPGQTQALADNTHHNVYGGYELAKCIVEGIKAKVPALAKFLTNDTPAYDPSHPDAPESVQIPQSPSASTEKPAGS